MVGVLALPLAPMSGARAHGEEVDVVVEALARGGDDLGVVDYGIALTYADGDPVEGAEVAITAVPEESVSTEPVTATVPGIYIGRLVMPSPGTWRITVSFEHPDASGSVEFTQEVRDPAPAAPIVLVDTLNPDRVGTVALDETSILGPAAAGPVVVDHAGEVIVEAFIADATAPLRIEYAVAVTAGRDPVDGVALAISGRSAAGGTIEAMPLAEVEGVHRATVTYPNGGLWTLTIELSLPSGEERIEFGENLPWPHYTTEAGTPKVKYDNVNPERIGTLATAAESVYLSGTQEPTPTPSTTVAESPPTTAPPVDDVVVDLPSSGDALRQDIGLRLLHLAAIALWSIPLFAAALGRGGRFIVPAALVGMSLTVATGVALSLYGAPLSFPGLFRWGELQERLYGPSYGAAFIVKMVTVGLAAGGTVVWALRRSKKTAWVTLGSMAGALVGVTLMSQFHLFSHL
jgi:YtkA-like